MTSSLDFSKAMTAWAERTPSVVGLVLIGSRERSKEDLLWRADSLSDWDFQIITSQPALFERRSWATDITGSKLLSYAARTATIGGVPKVSAIFSDFEVDFVIIPAASARLMRTLVGLGLHRRSSKVRRRLQDLAVVIRPGWRFLKGGSQWEEFYRRITAEVSDPRLCNEMVQKLAEGFACDYIWTLRKIERGELRAAQRMLYRELAEVNYRLLHELKLRRVERTFPEARRLERIASDEELRSVTVQTALEKSSLREAVEKSAATCRDLLSELIGDLWQWPYRTLMDPDPEASDQPR